MDIRPRTINLELEYYNYIFIFVTDLLFYGCYFLLLDRRNGECKPKYQDQFQLTETGYTISSTTKIM